jgi:hypothetical protein
LCPSREQSPLCRRRSEITRAVKAVTDAGLFVSAVRINPQGQVEVVTAKRLAQDSKGDLDVWLAKRSEDHARSAKGH